MSVDFRKVMIIHKRGRGLDNKIINKLQFELHIPGYQYYGPGTKLAKRLARGDLGINPLDAACTQRARYWDLTFVYIAN